MLVRRYKCDCCFTQMFHSSILSKKKDYFENHFTTAPGDAPLVIQVRCWFNSSNLALRAQSRRTLPISSFGSSSLRKRGFESGLSPRNCSKRSLRCVFTTRLWPNSKNSASILGRGHSILGKDPIIARFERYSSIMWDVAKRRSSFHHCSWPIERAEARIDRCV